MQRFLKRFSFIWVLLTLLASPLYAEKIVDVKVRGNGKVEAEAIITILKSQAGEELSSGKIKEDLKALYDLGYFSEIRFLTEPAQGGVHLVIDVEEKPSIVEIKWEGLQELGDSDFKDKLETKLYTIVNETTITNDLRIIERIYVEKGFFLTKANYVLEPVPDRKHEVKLIYRIEEGGKVQVGDLAVNGNNYFSETDIVSKFMSRPLTRLGAYGSLGAVYNEDFVKRDAEVLSFLYKDQGFAEVKVANPITLMDNDRQFVRINMDVEEGLQYNVGTITVSGDLLFPEAELLEAMKLKPGGLFRFSQFRADIDMLMEKYGDKGYAFVDVDPQTKPDREKRLMHINYKITKGDKVYFGLLDVVGNTKTRDNVIRREFEIGDGQLYSGTGLNNSRKNVERLGFFEEIQAIKRRDEENQTLLHYKFKMKEKPTGQLQAAVGYSPGGGGTQSSWFGQGRYSEENQSGKGWKTSLTARWNGGKSYSLELGFTDPRVNDSFWSLGFSTFLRNDERPIFQGVSILEKRYGGSVTLGRKIIELLRGSVTYKITKVVQDSDEFILERFKEEGIISSAIFALSRDGTNNYLDPTEGTKVRLSQEVAGGPFLGGDRKYLETLFNGTVYLPVDFTEAYRTYFRVNTEFGLLQPYGDEPVPFFTRYRLGGPEDLRGYSLQSIGPSFNILQSPGDIARRIVKGGNRKLLMQFEYFFPIIQEANIKGVVFADAGRVFDDEESFKLTQFKQDVGFGFRWITPMAPFRFEWAYPYENGQMGPLEFIFYLGY